MDGAASMIAGRPHISEGVEIVILMCEHCHCDALNCAMRLIERVMEQSEAVMVAIPRLKQNTPLGRNCHVRMTPAHRQWELAGAHTTPQLSVEYARLKPRPPQSTVALAGNSGHLQPQISLLSWPRRFNETAFAVPCGRPRAYLAGQSATVILMTILLSFESTKETPLIGSLFRW